MKHKQTLKVRKQLNKQFVSIERSNRVYVDDAYYKSKFKEDKSNPQYKNFPVKIIAIKADWIIQDEEGKEFLRALISS